MNDMNEVSESGGIEHLECVDEAVISVLNKTCGVELALQADDVSLGDTETIVGIISLIGHVDWSMSLGFSSEAATVLASKFAGFEIPFDSDDMGDAIGEIANIIAGEVKANLDRKAIKTNISLPNVFRGAKIQLLKGRGVTSSKAFYESSVGMFWVGINAKRKDGQIHPNTGNRLAEAI